MSSEYGFRLFSYLAMAIVSIAILVGLLFLFQHTELNTNQSHVLENQILIKDIITKITDHEEREESYLGNSSDTNVVISNTNSKKLDLILDYLNITKR